MLPQLIYRNTHKDSSVGLGREFFILHSTFFILHFSLILEGGAFMALVTTKELFEKAYAGGYAIGAFNFNNMETIQAIAEACREEHSPVILQVSQDVLENHTYYRKLVEAALQECADIPIAWHLDHGSSLEICKACIDGGYSSVMIDGSSLPFEENIALTRSVVEYAHDRGVVVEAELGALAGIEDEVSVSAEAGIDVLEFFEMMVDDTSYVDMEALGAVLNNPNFEALLYTNVPSYNKELANTMVEEAGKFLLGQDTLENVVASLMAKGQALMAENAN